MLMRLLLSSREALYVLWALEGALRGVRRRWRTVLKSCFGRLLPAFLSFSFLSHNVNCSGLSFHCARSH